MSSDNQHSDKEYGRPGRDTIAGPLQGKGKSGYAAAANPRDDEGDEVLPLLVDVIEPGELGSDAWQQVQADTPSTASPTTGRAWQSDGDLEQDVLAFKLRAQFSDDLEEIVRSAVSSAVDGSVRDLEKNLHYELMNSLESRLGEILSKPV